MNDERTDPKAALREPAVEEEAAIAPHPGWKRLLAYREGTVGAAEREALQEHLSLCRRCSELLRELRDFETESAAGAAPALAGRGEAWNALLERLPPALGLPSEHPPTRPGAERSSREPSPPRRISRLAYAAAAALLLAMVGLAAWTAGRVQQERRRVAELEQRLAERHGSLAALEASFVEARRRLEAANERLRRLEQEAADRSSDRERELAAQTAELRAEVEALRREAEARAGDAPRMAARRAEVAAAPRFVLRQEGPPGAFSRPGGELNIVRLPPAAEPITMLLDLSGRPAFDEYRLELLSGEGETLWAGRRRASALLGDAGTAISLRGLEPGRYRLRVEGLRPGGTDLLDEYLLEVEGK